MDRKRANELRDELDILLSTFAEKNGLSKPSLRGSFDMLSFKIAVQFGEKEAVGEGNVKWLKNYRAYSMYFGMCPEDLGTSLVINGKSFKIVGMTSSDFFAGENVMGKVFRLPAESVRAARANRKA